MEPIILISFLYIRMYQESIVYYHYWNNKNFHTLLSYQNWSRDFSISNKSTTIYIYSYNNKGIEFYANFLIASLDLWS